MIFSPEGLPGPGHTGRETLDTQGSLIIRNVTTLDASSYTVVLETSGGRRSTTEQVQVKGKLTPHPSTAGQEGQSSQSAELRIATNFF